MRVTLSLTKRGIVHIRPLPEYFQGVFELLTLILITLWRCPVCLREAACIEVFLAARQEVALGEGGFTLPKGLHDGLLQRGALKRPFSPDLDHHIKGELHLQRGAGEKL